MKHRWMRVAVVFMIGVSLLAGCVVLQYSIDSQASTVRGSSTNAPYDAARSILDVLGGVRELLAAYLWTKTDDVFHHYQGEDIASQRPIYPYYWLIAKLDPHYVEAYYFASWMLCRFGKPQEGFDFAIEGLRNNPDSELLQKNLADIYLFHKHDPLKAKYHLQKALELTKDNAEKQIVLNEMRTVDLILSGQRPMPNLMTIDKERELNRKQYKELHKD